MFLKITWCPHFFGLAELQKHTLPAMEWCEREWCFFFHHRRAVTVDLIWCLSFFLHWSLPMKKTCDPQHTLVCSQVWSIWDENQQPPSLRPWHSGSPHLDWGRVAALSEGVHISFSLVIAWGYDGTWDQIGAAKTVMYALYLPVVVKTELIYHLTSDEC